MVVEGVLVFYLGLGQDLEVRGADWLKGQFQHFIAVASEQLGVAFLLFHRFNHPLVDPVGYGHK